MFGAQIGLSAVMEKTPSRQEFAPANLKTGFAAGTFACCEN
jgi:hypothetical protein